MNIIVRPTCSDLCYCRPDTTWERENRDLYSPEHIQKWHWTPVLFARICKAGKCISDRYASRYYDGINFGVLLYADNENGLAFASCADHTSILPAPLFNPLVMEGEDNEFRLSIDGTERFSCSEGPDSGHKILIEDSICKASGLTSLRIGDFVAVELAPLEALPIPDEGEAVIKGQFCGKDIFDFRIIY